MTCARIIHYVTLHCRRRTVGVDAVHPPRGEPGRGLTARPGPAHRPGAGPALRAGVGGGTVCGKECNGSFPVCVRVCVCVCVCVCVQ